MAERAGIGHVARGHVSAGSGCGQPSPLRGVGILGVVATAGFAACRKIAFGQVEPGIAARAARGRRGMALFAIGQVRLGYRSVERRAGVRHGMGNHIAAVAERIIKTPWLRSRRKSDTGRRCSSSQMAESAHWCVRRVGQGVCSCRSRA